MVDGRFSARSGMFTNRPTTAAEAWGGALISALGVAIIVLLSTSSVLYALIGGVVILLISGAYRLRVAAKSGVASRRA